jgi:hypothetical protein
MMGGGYYSEKASISFQKDWQYHQEVLQRTFQIAV